MNKLLVTMLCAAMLNACVNSAPHKATAKATHSPDPIAVTTLTKTEHSWNGSLLPEYQVGQPEVTILRIVIQPGVTLNWHQHPIINAGIIVHGQIRVESEQGDAMEFKQGDTIVELVNQWHHGINHGKEPTELIVFYAGIAGTPLSIIKDAGPAASDN